MAQHYRVTVGYLPDEPPPLDPDWGYPGARPAVLERPGPTNTGARLATVETLTGAQAVTAIRNATVESDGKRYLRRALIAGGELNLNTIQSEAVVFEDCVIDGPSALYVVRSYHPASVSEPTTWPEFRYCTIRGGTSTTVIGGYVRLLRCDISQGIDLLKPFQPMEVWSCYLHHNWYAAEAHCDSVQIVSGCPGAIFQHNSFLGRISPDAPLNPSGHISGVLQIGTITAPIGVPNPVQFLDNWVEGGTYGFRGSSNDSTGYECNLVFRRNRFVRGSFQYGPAGNMGGPGDDFDSSNVWDDDGTPVAGGGY